MGTFDKPIPILITSKHITYTDHQLAVLEGLVKWVNNSSELICVLEGAAGTGKTTIITDFIKNIRIGSSACSAPTHKAVRVINKMTGITSFTVQKLLGMRPNHNIDNFDINNPYFTKSGKAKIELYKVIVVDEASMLSTSILTYIKEESAKYKTKVLLVGDGYQIPPVKESTSAVFKWKNKFVLHEIMRQEKGNPLLELLKAVRLSIDNNNYDFLKLLPKNTSFINADNTGYAIVNAETFTRGVDKYFTSDEFSKNITHCRYLAFTNDSILEWNLYIRSLIVKSTDYIHKDDLVTAYNTIVDEFNAPIITNSDEYFVSEIDRYRNRFMTDGFIVRLKSADTGAVTIPMFIIDHNNPASNDNFLKTFNTLMINAKRSTFRLRSKTWKQYYNFKDNNLIMLPFKDDAGKIMVSKDLDYGYGLTIHKS